MGYLGKLLIKYFIVLEKKSNCTFVTNLSYSRCDEYKGKFGFYKC